MRRSLAPCGQAMASIAKDLSRALGLRAPVMLPRHLSAVEGCLAGPRWSSADQSSGWFVSGTVLDILLFV